MKPPRDRRPKGRSALPDAASYEVGYSKPPEHSRFRKGTSGNPRGRPKGAKNKTPNFGEERLKSIVLEEAYRMIGVRDGVREVKVPMAQAIVRAMAVNAVKGQHRAQRLFSELLGMTEAQDRRRNDEWLEAAITYKVDWEHELAQRALLGITGPEPLPHPDHVVIDLRNGTARIVGPATKEEKAKFDMWVERKKMFMEELETLQQEIVAEKDPGIQAFIRDEIGHTKKMLDILRRAVPD